MIQRLNKMLEKINDEYLYSLKMIDPFKEQFQLILNQKTEFFLKFLDDMREFTDKNVSDENERKKQIFVINLMQLDHMYHLSDDFVLNCE